MRNEKNSSKKVTIYDVAEEAGVSYATVSRVINNKGYVSEEAHKRVMTAMTHLGFAVNQQARSLAGGQSRVIGFLIENDSVTAYQQLIMQGVLTELNAAHYETLLYGGEAYKGKEWLHVTKLKQGIGEGLILLTYRNIDAEAYIEPLKEQHVPYVMVDYGHLDNPGPSVRATNWQGGYDGTTYLIELGHQHIGFLTGILEWGNARERLEGYKAALRDHKLPFNPTLVRDGAFSQLQGHFCTQELLSLPEPPTAIFASNDGMALGAMNAIRDHGLHVAEDVSVIGFDDIPQASDVYPLLTTVRQPLEAMGRTAARQLIALIQHPDQSPGVIELPTELIIRGTAQPPRK